MSQESPLKNPVSPQVSVIMNCLNCEKHLAQSLACLKNQTFKDFEIIFWDNGSTDQSASLAKDYGAGLRYFRGEKTVPLGQARNLAIAQARGDLIAFLDCDDLWEPRKLEKQVELFNANPGLGLACTDTVIFNERKTLDHVFGSQLPPQGQVYGDLIRRQWISMSSAMLRRAALDGILAENRRAGLEQTGWFDERLNVCEEADVFYRIAHAWDLGNVEEALTFWRVHGQNTTFKKFGQFARETRLILQKQRRLYPDFDSEHADLAELMRGRADFQEALALWREGKGGQARKLLQDRRHLSVKQWLLWWATFLPGSFFSLLAGIYFRLPKALRG